VTREREHLEQDMTEKLENLRRESNRQMEEARNRLTQ
jgi:hypothetical protein